MGNIHLVMGNIHLTANENAQKNFLQINNADDIYIIPPELLKFTTQIYYKLYNSNSIMANQFPLTDISTATAIINFIDIILAIHPTAYLHRNINKVDVIILAQNLLQTMILTKNMGTATICNDIPAELA